MIVDVIWYVILTLVVTTIFVKIKIFTVKVLVKLLKSLWGFGGEAPEQLPLVLSLSVL